MRREKANRLKNNKKFSCWVLLYFLFIIISSVKKQETYMPNDNKFTYYFHIKLDF